MWVMLMLGTQTKELRLEYLTLVYLTTEMGIAGSVYSPVLLLLIS